MTEDVEEVYEDDAITVKKYRLTNDHSLIYMVDRSGQREFCMNESQFNGIIKKYLKLRDKK